MNEYEEYIELKAEGGLLTSEKSKNRWYYPVMQNQGFEDESYRYWVHTYERYGEAIPHYTHLGHFIANCQSAYTLFIVKEVDTKIDRLKFASHIKRDEGTKFFAVRDYKGLTHYAVLLRGWEGKALMKCFPKNESIASKIYYAEEWQGLMFQMADKYTPRIITDPYAQQGQDGTVIENGRTLESNFPTWYFLTGSLARTDKLQKLLKREHPPTKRKATIEEFKKLEIRQCNTIARLPVPNRSRHTRHKLEVEGYAYLIESLEEENRLRYYKTDIFMVRSCMIKLADTKRKIHGYMFLWKLNEAAFEAMASIPISQMQDATDGDRRPGDQSSSPTPENTWTDMSDSASQTSNTSYDDDTDVDDDGDGDGGDGDDDDDDDWEEEDPWEQDTEVDSDEEDSEDEETDAEEDDENTSSEGENDGDDDESTSGETEGGEIDYGDSDSGGDGDEDMDEDSDDDSDEDDDEDGDEDVNMDNDVDKDKDEDEDVIIVSDIDTAVAALIRIRLKIKQDGLKRKNARSGVEVARHRMLLRSASRPESPLQRVFDPSDEISSTPIDDPGTSSHQFSRFDSRRYGGAITWWKQYQGSTSEIGPPEPISETAYEDPDDSSGCEHIEDLYPQDTEVVITSEPSPSPDLSAPQVRFSLDLRPNTQDQHRGKSSRRNSSIQRFISEAENFGSVLARTERIIRRRKLYCVAEPSAFSLILRKRMAKCLECKIRPVLCLVCEA